MRHSVPPFAAVFHIWCEEHPDKQSWIGRGCSLLLHVGYRGYSADSRQKLSTPAPRCLPLTHNRFMNDATIEGLGRFLTLADTAELLNISPKRTYALIRSGELPAIKVGTSGHWRVERSVIEDYIDAMYEETRRMSLWNQSEFADLTESAFGESRVR